MSWNYRIVKYKDGSGYGLHEVYYNDDGSAWAMSEKPIGFDSDSIADIQADLSMALKDAKKKVFEEPEKWAEHKKT